MYSTVLLILLFTGLVSSVSACEGDCIVRITNAFLGNLSKPIDEVLKDLSDQISEQLLPPSQRPADPTSLLQPILKAYADISYEKLETAIFPSYFHGKCQRFSKDGQDPPGCPNPDCPVVCGTPGSLVHFYPKLRLIAFNNTKSTLEKIASPGSPAYTKVEAMIKEAQLRKSGKRDLVATHGMGSVIEPRSAYWHGKRLHPRFFGAGRKRDMLRQQNLQARSSPTLESILGQFDFLFSKACGGKPGDSKDSLPNCSWEIEMKKYILSFP
ncbi:uncharacterized protein FOMMEDRAFT_149302 [Fomitiporia mediterranea MF3/22]|uniref:uncharacterized protein n=1 Tax=Fomitiporia mediterranea (strain MF3/22) TaxID=694068 RepID=UPI00044081B6|nr:uncharacterized protein FOMMEDRAFT_149302 [Fomitiporia mediterranea MF3/22]EJC98285.1 hypothetical protein FOMMEDRAFT_149302 [Fomitiporia mediterranea MF3/22]